ncbi:hypothetical protein BB558_003251 [Smittium angustum]|uniref:Myb-like domain-containing protein n=1 Tax=Smittium angustum TaxID=133377 RepID=A0A2U1J6H5_SMIAN|nr:hypothetical protein BB558_003251 [Smittium angustum]
MKKSTKSSTNYRIRRSAGSINPTTPNSGKTRKFPSTVNVPKSGSTIPINTIDDIYDSFNTSTTKRRIRISGLTKEFQKIQKAQKLKEKLSPQPSPEHLLPDTSLSTKKYKTRSKSFTSQNTPPDTNKYSTKSKNPSSQNTSQKSKLNSQKTSKQETNSTITESKNIQTTPNNKMTASSKKLHFDQSPELSADKSAQIETPKLKNIHSNSSQKKHISQEYVHTNQASQLENDSYESMPPPAQNQYYQQDFDSNADSTNQSYNNLSQQQNSTYDNQNITNNTDIDEHLISQMLNNAQENNFSISIDKSQLLEASKFANSTINASNNKPKNNPYTIPSESLDSTINEQDINQLGTTVYLITKRLTDLRSIHGIIRLIDKETIFIDEYTPIIRTSPIENISNSTSDSPFISKPNLIRKANLVSLFGCVLVPHLFFEFSAGMDKENRKVTNLISALFSKNFDPSHSADSEKLSIHLEDIKNTSNPPTFREEYLDNNYTQANLNREIPPSKEYEDDDVFQEFENSLPNSQPPKSDYSQEVHSNHDDYYQSESEDGLFLDISQSSKKELTGAGVNDGRSNSVNANDTNTDSQVPESSQQEKRSHIENYLRNYAGAIYACENSIFFLFYDQSIEPINLFKELLTQVAISKCIQYNGDDMEDWVNSIFGQGIDLIKNFITNNIDHLSAGNYHQPINYPEIIKIYESIFNIQKDNILRNKIDDLPSLYPLDNFERLVLSFVENRLLDSFLKNVEPVWTEIKYSSILNPQQIPIQDIHTSIASASPMPQVSKVLPVVSSSVFRSGSLLPKPSTNVSNEFFRAPPKADALSNIDKINMLMAKANEELPMPVTASLIADSELKPAPKVQKEKLKSRNLALGASVHFESDNSEFEAFSDGEHESNENSESEKKPDADIITMDEMLGSDITTKAIIAQNNHSHYLMPGMFTNDDSADEDYKESEESDIGSSNSFDPLQSAMKKANLLSDKYKNKTPPKPKRQPPAGKARRLGKRVLSEPSEGESEEELRTKTVSKDGSASKRVPKKQKVSYKSSEKISSPVYSKVKSVDKSIEKDGLYYTRNDSQTELNISSRRSSHETKLLQISEDAVSANKGDKDNNSGAGPSAIVSKIKKTDKKLLVFNGSEISAETEENQIGEQSIEQDENAINKGKTTPAKQISSTSHQQGQRKTKKLASEFSKNLDEDDENVRASISTKFRVPLSPTSKDRLSVICTSLKPKGEKDMNRRKNWTKPEVECLDRCISYFGGPFWSKMLSYHGKNGTYSEILSERNQGQLKDKARNIVKVLNKNGVDLGPYHFISKD